MLIWNEIFRLSIEVLLSSYFKRSLRAFLIFQIMFYGYIFRKSKDFYQNSKRHTQKIIIFYRKAFFKAVLRLLIYKFVITCLVF